MNLVRISFGSIDRFEEMIIKYNSLISRNAVTDLSGIDIYTS